MVKYVIVGAGISGLYCAYSLVQKFDTRDIIIIEKNNRLGGRIETKHIDSDTFIEMGAGGIIDTQLDIMAVIQELGLSIAKGGGGGRSLAVTSVVSTNEYIVPTIYTINDIVHINDTDFYDVINDIIDRMRDDNFRSMALSYSLYMLIEKLYGNEKAEQLMYQFGYHTDFHDQNSVEAVKMFYPDREFNRNSKFHRVNGGMSHIIKALADWLQKAGITVKLNEKCLEIDRIDEKYIVHTNKNIITAENIIFAIPKMNLLEIKYLTDRAFDKINSVIHKPLLRIYAFYPLINGKAWFDHIQTTLTTKTLLSQIIPYNKEKGILMIYCDGRNARAWNYFNDNNVLVRELQYHLIKLFSDLVIPEPTKTYVSYHDSATHVWKPSINPYQMYEEVVKPIDNENIFIVGEAYSINQQWSQGAIESVNHLMNLLVD